MSSTMTRPLYVSIVTQNSKGKLGPETREVEVCTVQGLVGEVLGACQAIGADEGYNWLIDSVGTVYELCGWDKGTPWTQERYLIGCVLPVTKTQQDSLGWLLGQLARKRNVTEVITSE